MAGLIHLELLTDLFNKIGQWAIWSIGGFCPPAKRFS